MQKIKILSLGVSVMAVAGFLMVATIQVASAACVKNVAYGDKLNIRTGPGSGYRKKGAIPRHACHVKVYWGNKVGSWLDVRYAGVRGWVHKSYIGGSGGGMGRVCKPRIKIFKSGGAGSWFSGYGTKYYIRDQAMKKWRNKVRQAYGARYNWIGKAKGYKRHCSRDKYSDAYVCKVVGRPCPR